MVTKTKKGNHEKKRLCCSGSESRKSRNLGNIVLQYCKGSKHGYFDIRRNPCKPSKCEDPKDSNWIKLIFVKVVNFHVNWNFFLINPWFDPKLQT